MNTRPSHDARGRPWSRRLRGPCPAVAGVPATVVGTGTVPAGAESSRTRSGAVSRRVAGTGDLRGSGAAGPETDAVPETVSSRQACVTQALERAASGQQWPKCSRLRDGVSSPGRGRAPRHRHLDVPPRPEGAPPTTTRATARNPSHPRAAYPDPASEYAAPLCTARPAGSGRGTGGRTRPTPPHPGDRRRPGLRLTRKHPATRGLGPVSSAPRSPTWSEVTTRRSSQAG